MQVDALRADLTERLTEIRNRRSVIPSEIEQLVGELNALIGAEQEVMRMLLTLSTEENDRE